MRLPGAFLTLLPPPLTWGRGRVAEYVETAFGVLKGLDDDAAFLIVEVRADAGYGPRPVPPSPKMPLLEFASALRKMGGRVFVSRYLWAEPDPPSWLERAKGVVEGVVIVGKVRASDPGPDVLSLLRAASGYYESVGAILIPHRRGEVERVCSKVEAGAGFFITQILLESATLRSLLRRVRERCPFNVAVYPSVVPVLNDRTLQLLRWMGVRFPPSLQKYTEIVRDLTPLPEVRGFNYEHVLYSNLRPDFLSRP